MRWWKAAPHALLEPHASGVVNSVETVHAFREEVPGVRLLVDTGHVANWGGDPCELLDLADHVQLRQGCPGHTQLHADDPRGVVDFDAVFARLDALDYRGKFSIEYFDLPEYGWSLDDPAQWARDLRARLTGPRGNGNPGVGIPSNATRLPGIASVTNNVRRSAPPKQQLVDKPSPSIGRKSSTVPSWSTMRMPCSMVDAT